MGLCSASSLRSQGSGVTDGDCPCQNICRNESRIGTSKFTDARVRLRSRKLRLSSIRPCLMWSSSCSSYEASMRNWRPAKGPLAITSAARLQQSRYMPSSMATFWTGVAGFCMGSWGSSRGMRSLVPCSEESASVQVPSSRPAPGLPGPIFGGLGDIDCSCINKSLVKTTSGVDGMFPASKVGVRAGGQDPRELRSSSSSSTPKLFAMRVR
mmetsp:Transcript_46353/g.82837  ORF Transcript_46353/g.82837 Transcript_46353/m.82837 type:complete len:211 (+) Transcript_46353:1583-2215(+)